MMRDTEGTVVIAEAVKNADEAVKKAKAEQRMRQIVSDLLCALCDNNCTVGEAFDALEATEAAITATRLHVEKYGNNPEMEGVHAEGGE